MTEERKPEELRIQGSQLVDRVRDLIHEGNVRRLQVRQEGRTILEIPLTVAAVGVLVAPMLAALGAFAALVTECTLVVERTDRLPGGTAGDTWAELNPGDTSPSSLETGTTGGPGVVPDLPEAPGEPGSR